MKCLRRIFKVSLAKIFFVTNYIICAMIFDWDNFFKYLETPARINCHLPSPSSGGHIDFSVYGFYNYSVVEEMFHVIFSIFLVCFTILFYILAFPSIAITEITLGMLKKTFSLWCLETYDIIYIPILAVINSFYWICLAHIIELAHAKYLELKPPAKKPLSVFPD